MFTGTVKLAQIDDYINPGQSCIQPKIMKQADKLQKATVTLNDCLACSGCITSAESVLIEQMSIQKLMQMIHQDQSRPLVAMLAPQVVIALALKFGKSPQSIFHILRKFLKEKLKAVLVLDLWQGIELAHQLGHQEYLQRKQKTLLCSQCPGWICYAQKTLNQQIVKLLSRVKSPQQVLGRVVKQRIPNSLVLSVMPCYDKKLQAIRFDIEKGIKEVDITITTTELLQLYKSIEKIELEQANFQEKEIPKSDRLIYEQVPFGFILDQAANGHVEALLARLGATDTKKQEVKNSDFVQYEAVVEGQVVKMAKCYGFRNIQRIVQAIKKNKCEYSYVQIMACPGGCYSGGGQPKFQNSKPKEISEKSSLISSEFTIKHKYPLSKETFNKLQTFKADYKVIEQTLTQAVMNW